MFGAIASIAGPLLGSAISGQATQQAADTQAGATRLGIDEQRREYDQNRTDQAPYRDAGTAALDQLKLMLGIGHDPAQKYTREQYRALYNTTPYGDPAIEADIGNTYDRYAKNYDAGMYTGTDANTPQFGSLNKKFSVADFWNDPVVQTSYQSGLDLGTKALKNRAPLTTGLDSGAALKELTKFGTDYTGNMAAGSQQRYVGDQNNAYNRLMAMINGGQVATQATGAAGTNMANNVSGMTTALGNSQGAAQIAGANSWGNGLQSVSNYWNQQNMLNRFAPQATPVSNFYNSGAPGQYSLSNTQYG